MAFVAIALGIVTWAGYVPAAAGYICAGLIFAAFVALVGWHERIENELAENDVVVQFNRERMGRLDRDWSRIPDFQACSMLASLPIARDLDLLAGRSVVRLISESHTPQGQSTL